MENKKNNGMLTTIIVLLLLVIVGLIIYIVYDKNAETDCQCTNCSPSAVDTTGNSDDSNLDDEEITLDDLVGTYTWKNTYTDDDKNECELSASLTLNKDHTATYEYTDCSGTTKTNGSYNYVGNEVIYNNDNSETIFDVLNKDTLEKQTVLENKIVRLTK